MDSYCTSTFYMLINDLAGCDSMRRVFQPYQTVCGKKKKLSKNISLRAFMLKLSRLNFFGQAQFYFGHAQFYFEHAQFRIEQLLNFSAI